jgi:hypothetical protein
MKLSATNKWTYLRIEQRMIFLVDTDTPQLNIKLCSDKLIIKLKMLKNSSKVKNDFNTQPTELAI